MSSNPASQTDSEHIELISNSVKRQTAKVLLLNMSLIILLIAAMLISLSAGPSDAGIREAVGTILSIFGIDIIDYLK